MIDQVDYAYGSKAYATYLRTPGIDGKNFQGNPCPTFDELPEQIQRGWGRASLMAAGLTRGSFGWALAQLAAGEKVARADWGGYWVMCTSQFFPKFQSSSLDEPMVAFKSRELVLAVLKDGGVAPAQPYWADMLANDWKIVE